MQESLAAAVLYISGFGIAIPDWQEPSKSTFESVKDGVDVYDPFCGSGTLLIEGTTTKYEVD